jgi:hypothetical protein
MDSKRLGLLTVMPTIQDLGCPKLPKLVLALKRFWKQSQQNQSSIFNNPFQLSEFQAALDILDSLTYEDIAGHPEFIQRLMSSMENQEILVFSNKKIVVKLLLFPPKYLFDLHDHPEMLLFSKILKGDAVISKYDLVNRDQIYQSLGRADFSKAVVVKRNERVVGAGDIDMLFPDWGNLHSIQCSKRLVLLDVMVNAYDFTKRPCSFFRIGERIQDDYFEAFYFTDNMGG